MIKDSGSFKGKTAFITGASRGIGKAIALRLASEGANVAVVAKTVTAHPKLPGTIYSAAEEIEQAGGKALAIPCDIRFEEQIVAALKQTFEHFGSIDIVINNASAINLSCIEGLSMKAFDLMNQINIRGTFAVSKHAIQYLRKAKNPHILMLSPPISLETRWFSHHTAYTMAKYGMSMCALGMAQEVAPLRIAVNALWPKTVIATAALNAISAEAADLAHQGRKPEIVADAAAVILRKPSSEFTGNFCIDQQVLEHEGMRDFSRYSVAGIEEEKLLTDLFVDSGAIGESKL
jgi:citronellol/citronellal dehydrogenase